MHKKNVFNLFRFVTMGIFLYLLPQTREAHYDWFHEKSRKHDLNKDIWLNSLLI